MFIVEYFNSDKLSNKQLPVDSCNCATHTPHEAQTVNNRWQSYTYLTHSNYVQNNRLENSPQWVVDHENDEPTISTTRV